MKKSIIPIRSGLFLILLLFAAACSKVTPVAESDYSIAIVGQWLGKVDGMEESILFSPDGNFSARMRPNGFISNTLSEGATGGVSGTWSISGETITLRITASEHERIINSETASTILTFNKNELRLKSDQNETSTFHRAVSL